MNTTIETIISDWKDDKNWVGDILNPFLEKKAFGWMNPIKEGEYLLLFTIDERTTFVDGQLEPYHSFFSYHTYCMGGTEEEKGRELRRLISELEDFTERAKEERLKQFEEWEKDGKDAATSNPFAF